MAIKCYGSLEAYQKSFSVPNPSFEAATSPSSPGSSHSSAGGLTPPSVHVISSNHTQNKQNTQSAQTAQNAHKVQNSTNSSADANRTTQAEPTDFWGRRRKFRRSIFETLTGKWGNQTAITNGKSGTSGSNNVQRANTSYSGGLSPKNNESVNRRASTGAASSPLK